MFDLSEVDSAVAGVPHPLRRVKDVRDAQQTEVLSIPSRCPAVSPVTGSVLFC